MPASSTDCKGSAPLRGNKEARTSISLPAQRCRKLAGSSSKLKSSMTTSRSARCCSRHFSSSCSTSVADCRGGGAKALPPTCSSCSTTKVARPAVLASFTIGLWELRLMTALTSAGKAQISVASSNALRGVAKAVPPSTTQCCRETMCGSCREDKTCGKGSETPSSGSISQQLSAPSMCVWGWPSERFPSSPMTQASSSIFFRRDMTSSFLSLATTSTMPMPQLKVAANSSQGILHLAAIHRKTGGSSQASALSCAFSVLGNTRGMLRDRPPRVTGAAPFSRPALDKACRGCT
mmetsp:Transcript_19296/g.45658  ORF Transcript_19296/g.45658 Transcript_19296/m.45658 type:complete len:293 (-) Transcript_19296:4274-5152(-)